MICTFTDQCGGCMFRHLSVEDYQNQKINNLHNILQRLNTSTYTFAEPVFIGDEQRRRASLAFCTHKGKLTLGFNARGSNTVVNLDKCLLLTPGINRNLIPLYSLLSKLCTVKIMPPKNRKKAKPYFLSAGDIIITEAANGLDVVLEFDEDLNLDHRMEIFEFCQNSNDIIRISHRHHNLDNPETIVEKARPFINIADYQVYIPAGTFLQASVPSEQAMINTVLRYARDVRGKIADLFCGIGTFSYPLSRLADVQILSVDSSPTLLDGFKHSVNKNMIPNIAIKAQNLFKYPLDAKDLSGYDLVLFDPPRAGAKAQAQQLATMGTDAPHKVIAVSCNPNSFVNDANELIAGGYQLQEITLIDQFHYSNHSELVALFTK